MTVLVRNVRNSQCDDAELPYSTNANRTTVGLRAHTVDKIGSAGPGAAGHQGSGRSVGINMYSLAVLPGSGCNTDRRNGARSEPRPRRARRGLASLFGGRGSPRRSSPAEPWDRATATKTVSGMVAEGRGEDVLARAGGVPLTKSSAMTNTKWGCALAASAGSKAGSSMATPEPYDLEPSFCQCHCQALPSINGLLAQAAREAAPL